MSSSRNEIAMDAVPQVLRLPRGDVLRVGGNLPCRVMGILNVTDDSFSDGGLFRDAESAIEHAQQMVEDGVDVIDIGGESTRPGSDAVSPEEQMSRVLPVIEQLVSCVDVPISIDTSSAEVARAALSAGAQIVNDVTAMRGDAQMAACVADAGAPVILMHMLGTPKDMQQSPVYNDVVADVINFLRERVEAAEKAGISPEQIVVDPGFGFGKTLEHNLALLRGLDQFVALGRPILVGTSRKAMIGKILNNKPDQRLYGTLATVAAAVERGAAIVRVHDVKPTVDVVRVLSAVQGRDVD